MEKIGVREYRWLHTSGSRHPRKLHIQMSGSIFRYDDPPVIDERTGLRRNSWTGNQLFHGVNKSIAS